MECSALRGSPKPKVKVNEGTRSETLVVSVTVHLCKRTGLSAWLSWLMFFIFMFTILNNIPTQAKDKECVERCGVRMTLEL